MTSAGRAAAETIGDPEGNERLTSVNGLILLVLLAVEGVTIVRIGPLITPHVVVGLVLVGPVLLKCATTLLRFWRYYTGNPAYVRKGPPPLVLRIGGPLVLASTAAVFASGIALLAVRPGHGPLLFLHKVSFILWFAVMTVHTLGHVAQAARSTAAEYRHASTALARRRRTARVAVMVVAIAAGIGLAAALTPQATAWTTRGSGVHHDGRPH